MPSLAYPACLPAFPGLSLPACCLIAWPGVGYLLALHGLVSHACLPSSLLCLACPRLPALTSPALSGLTDYLFRLAYRRLN